MRPRITKDWEMAGPLFSVVIACYNHESFIREAVESALKQRYLSKEIIVVDDGSSDRTAEILRSFGDSITFKQLPVNGGAGAARNYGAAIAKGKYLVFLDGDDVFTPWTLKTYSRVITRRRPILVLGHSSLFWDEVPAIRHERLSDVSFVEYKTFLDKDRHWVYNSSSLVVERTAFWDAGGWSEDIFYQDIQDLLNKLCIAGSTCIVLAPETVLYRMHSSNAVRQIAPFLKGIDVLLEKARQGAYPGGRQVLIKRSAWFGGLVFYWAKEGMRHGYIVKSLQLTLRNWWRILLGGIKRIAELVGGRRPVEVLPLEENDSGSSDGLQFMPNVLQEVIRVRMKGRDTTV